MDHQQHKLLSLLKIILKPIKAYFKKLHKGITQKRKKSSYGEDITRKTSLQFFALVCALEMFNEDYVKFPRDDIAKLSGLTMPVNKRNWRKHSLILR